MSLRSAFSFLAFALAACSSSSPAPSSTTPDASPSSDASTSNTDAGAPIDSSIASKEAGGDASGACNSLQNLGAQVTPQMSNTDPPAITDYDGDTIADGTYVLASYVLYNPNMVDAGAVAQVLPMVETIATSNGGTTWQIVQQTSMGEYDSTYSVALNGSMYTATETCPTMSGGPSGMFKTTATTFTVYIPGAPQMGSRAC